MTSSFVQTLNPLTGQPDWQLTDERFDCIQEIARSAFTDMLHDDERNQKYFIGLKLAIATIKARNEIPFVLDIGTGTGILSMMAVSLGAGKVYACEAFEPMADCAKKIIAANGMADRITVVAKRSTSLKIGEDMPRRANILVTEVFDTELIGEGAMKTFSHAHEHLLEPGCVVVPSSARLFVQVVESPFCMAWNQPKLLPNMDGDILVRTPPSIQQCNGSQLLHDIQLSQLSAGSFTPLSPPIKVFDFDWSGRTKLKFNRSSVTNFPSLIHGQPQAVFMWWDLNMDEKGDVLLSCAPYWAHPDFETLKAQAKAPFREENLIPWRDHWMQAVYFLPTPVKMCQQDRKYRLIANHDEFSLWFGLTEESDTKTSSAESRCDCGFHMTYSRTRIGQLNSTWRNKKFMKLIEDTVTQSSSVLVLSEGSLLGLAAAAHGARNVYVLEPNRLSRAAMELYIDHNQLKNVKILERVSEVPEGVTIVLAEPHYNQSILPWDNFYFGTLLQQCLPQLVEDVQIFPGKGVIRAVAVHFLDLHKIQAVCKLRECHGFNMEIFDTLMEKATNLTDSNVEAQPLWEYPCVAISKAVDLLTVEFKDFVTKQEVVACIDFDEKFGKLNGIAIWVDWQLRGDKNVVTTGALQNIQLGKFVQWDIYTRQGVHFMVSDAKSENQIHCKTVFHPLDGKLTFNFE